MVKKTSSIKRDRFKNVASRRAQKVLDELDNLAKCSNKNTYEYTEEDIRKMMKAISDKVVFLKSAFAVGSKASKNTFEF